MTVQTRVGLLTGGSDKPYALGLACALDQQGLLVDMVGSDELDCPEVRRLQRVTFLNLRGDQREDAAFLEKATRVGAYYLRLIRYAASGRSTILHILWNNRFEWIDRTLLMVCYRVMGHRVILTAHNVNTAKRDSRDSWWNRATLLFQYRLCSHIFVHTDGMKREMCESFGVDEGKVSVIPFGINETIPKKHLTKQQARAKVGGVGIDERMLLCFGQIARYKGIEYLVSAAAMLRRNGQPVKVIVAGKVKRGHEDYLRTIQAQIITDGVCDDVIVRSEFVPDSDVEAFFMAADAVVLPYTDIFQSGVPFLAFAFGVPVIATDVGSLRQDVVEGTTGLICRPRDAADLAAVITRYFASRLYWNLEGGREAIRTLARQLHSWTNVGEITEKVYRATLGEGQLK